MKIVSIIGLELGEMVQGDGKLCPSNDEVGRSKAIGQILISMW